MYKSILASALITLSASSAFAFGWQDQINAGIAAQIQWNTIIKQIQYDVNYASRYFNHKSQGATDYNASTYAAFDASRHIGNDGSGIKVLVKDIHQGAGSHGESVTSVITTLAPGAVIDLEPNQIENAAEGYNNIVNESLGFDLVNDFDDGLAALNRHTWGDWTSQPITQSEIGSLAPLHRIASEYGRLGSKNCLLYTSPSPRD